MKKWMAVIPAAAAAAGAAALLIGKKKADKPAAPAKKAQAKAAPAFKNAQTGVYSFASGYKDAKTVSVALTFEGDTCSYAQAEEDFLCETGDSHVGILTAEKFSMQVEYAQYYSGEDFAAMTKSVAEKFGAVKPVSFNGVDGICYANGWTCCFALPATESDYVLFSAVYTCSAKDREKEGPLADNAKLLAVMNAVTIKAE